MEPEFIVVRDGSEAIKAFAEAANKSFKDAFRYTAASAMKHMIAITPPANAGDGSLTGSADAFRAGKMRIAHQMVALMAPVKLKGYRIITQVFGKPLKKPVRIATKEKWPDVRGVYRANSSTNATGRIKVHPGQKFYVDQRKFKQLLAYKQSRVGLLASGWIPAASALGLSVPAWVSRHGGSRGSVQLITEGTQMSLQAVDRVPGGAPAWVASETQRRAGYAVQYALNGLARQLPALANWAAKKAGLSTS